MQQQSTIKAGSNQARERFKEALKTQCSVEISAEPLRIFFSGIGGISMSGLARLADSLLSADICGSDRVAGNETAALAEDYGEKIVIGQSAENIVKFKPDLFVYTRAIPEDHPELLKAREMGILTLPREDFLGALNRIFDQVINVAGTNGKTTVSSLSSLILIKAGLDPCVHLGARFAAFDDKTVKVSQNLNLMLSEACEFRRSFLHFYSTTAVVLNIAHDHIDCYPRIEDLIEAFRQFILNLKPDTRLILPLFDNYTLQMLDNEKLLKHLESNAIKVVFFDCAFSDNSGLAAADNFFDNCFTKNYDLNNLQTEDLKKLKNEILRHKLARIENYTSAHQNQLSYSAKNLILNSPLTIAVNYQLMAAESRFDIIRIKSNNQAELNNIEIYRDLKLQIPGKFNLENAAAAVSIALEHDADLSAIKAALSEFKGAGGRFSYAGNYRGHKVIVDYAHHPVSVKATIAAVRAMNPDRIFAAFQAITHSRARFLADGFAEAIAAADKPVLHEIYDSREKDRLFSAESIAEAAKKYNRESIYTSDFSELKDAIDDYIDQVDLKHESCIILLMGSDIRDFGIDLPKMKKDGHSS